jgi:hypothetical protein
LRCRELGESPTRKGPTDYRTGQLHLQTDLLSGATQDPLGLPRLKRRRPSLQGFFDRAIDAFHSQGIRCGRLTAVESQRSEVQRFAVKDGDEFTYRGFSVAIIPDQVL